MRYLDHYKIEAKGKTERERERERGKEALSSSYKIAYNIHFFCFCFVLFGCFLKFVLIIAKVFFCVGGESKAISLFFVLLWVFFVGFGGFWFRERLRE
jgi:hypothetical protein